MTIDELTKSMRKIRRFAPFFLDKRLGDIIESLEELQRKTCGHCKYLTAQDDGVYYCKLYKSAKPWDGYCEKWEKR